MTNAGGVFVSASIGHTIRAIYRDGRWVTLEDSRAQPDYSVEDEYMHACAAHGHGERMTICVDCGAVISGGGE